MAAVAHAPTRGRWWRSSAILLAVGGSVEFYPESATGGVGESPRIGYATAIEPAESDSVADVAADATGSLWVVGSTGNMAFPITDDAADPVRAAFDDGYVAKLDPDGTAGLRDLPRRQRRQLHRRRGRRRGRERLHRRHHDLDRLPDHGWGGAGHGARRCRRRLRRQAGQRRPTAARDLLWRHRLRVVSGARLPGGQRRARAGRRALRPHRLDQLDAVPAPVAPNARASTPTGCWCASIATCDRAGDASSAARSSTR